ncbi:ThiF family adenylyltransferase [Desulfohalovibrio reitneri]|uniref:ThiF family adenylyltransferase n=1 Tax=Desulfohalovibrio reitneri TaxID=1307759 RepID=UPI00068C5498|nr:ThiF family adenylyltransferase [Desulfohalovibrio reitneri]
MNIIEDKRLEGPWAGPLGRLGITTLEQFQDEAFARNLGILDLAEQDRLSQATVCIPGMGGVGGQHLMGLVRLGIRRFRLADLDTFDLANFNRQYGATLNGLGSPKLDAMHSTAWSVNPFLEVEQYPDGLGEQNIYSFLKGADLVMDGLDFFEFPMRRRLFTLAREMGIPVVTAGPLGFGGALLVFTPEGMSFDRYFDIREGQTLEERFLRFGMGLAPKGMHLKYMDLGRVNLHAKAGPSTSIACHLCASLACMEAIRLLLDRPGVREAPRYMQFDPYLTRLRTGKLRWGNRGPVQRAKIFVASRFLLDNEPPAGQRAPDFPDTIMVGSSVSDEALRYIMHAGVAAPSGDNAQPWKLRPKSSAVGLHLDADADRSFFNVRQIASLISCGAVLENMRVAGAAMGLRGEVVEADSFPGNGPVAELRLTAAPEVGDALHDAIWERTTNRRLYSRKPVPEGVQRRLAREAGLVGGVRLHWLEGKESLERLARVVARADTIRTEHRGLHEHFHAMLRHSKDEARKTRDGLPVDNLYAGKSGELFLRATGPWPVMRTANLLGASRMMAMHSARGIRHSGAAVLLTTTGFGWEDFLRGGRALERCWLRLSQLGLAMQPMTAITLFRLRWVLEGEEEFDPVHRKRLRSLWPIYQELFPQANLDREGEVMLFRIGHARPITRGTLRRKLDSFIL